MQARTDGCALCGSTWGDYHEQVEGERRFFCCALCAKQFRRLCEAIREATGWKEIDRLELEGNRYGRVATAFRSGQSARFNVRFDADGELSRFSGLA